MKIKQRGKAIQGDRQIEYTRRANVQIAYLQRICYLLCPRQWGVADAEIKVPFDENTELKGSPCKAWRRSVYCHARYAYCQGFLPC